METVLKEIQKKKQQMQQKRQMPSLADMTPKKEEIPMMPEEIDPELHAQTDSAESRCKERTSVHRLEHIQGVTGEWLGMFHANLTLDSIAGMTMLSKMMESGDVEDLDQFLKLLPKGELKAYISQGQQWASFFCRAVCKLLMEASYEKKMAQLLTDTAFASSTKSINRKGRAVPNIYSIREWTCRLLKMALEFVEWGENVGLMYQMEDADMDYSKEGEEMEQQQQDEYNESEGLFNKHTASSYSDEEEDYRE